jgi:hypothetical protein
MLLILIVTNLNVKNAVQVGHFMPVILATEEAETGSTTVQVQLGKELMRPPSTK